MKAMKTLKTLKALQALKTGVVCTLALAAGCAARQPQTSQGDAKLNLSAPFEQAVLAEQTQGSEVAMRSYLDLIDKAIANPRAPHASEAIAASLDALVTRNPPGFERMAGGSRSLSGNPGG